MADLFLQSILCCASDSKYFSRNKDHPLRVYLKIISRSTFATGNLFFKYHTLFTIILWHYLQY